MCCCVVKSRSADHLTSNKLLNRRQSAYCKHYSTETALLYIHDHLINAIGSQKLSCLCLLDLSAAFDTIDHSILLTRLSSWFGIHGSVLNWFQSYLSSRSFHVRCNNTFSSLCTSSSGVPQGSVLGPLLFIMYTTSLSTLISSLFLSHHLYADDTQLFTITAPLPPPSFSPNSITVILSTTTYLSLRSPAPNRSRTLLPVLLLKLLNAVTSLLSYALFIGSK